MNLDRIDEVAAKAFPPMTPSYQRDPYLASLQTVVLETGTEEGRPFAILADTVLYPEGGGQPSDHGTLNGVPVLEVQKRDGAVRHLLASPVSPGPATVVLDWERRFDHMQQHTGQHLLTAVAQDRFGWATTAFHLGAESCDVELAAAGIPKGDLDRLEEAVNAVVRAARPVAARHVTADEYERLSVRSRGLPDGHVGEIRLVEIEGVDLNTCGGTHLSSTAGIESLKLLGTEALRGGTRLFFVAGGRTRRLLGTHEERSAALRALLGTPDAGLAAAVAARLESLRAAEKRVRSLEEELAGAAAALLASRPGDLVEAHWAGRDAAFLQRVARELQALAPRKAALLTASGSSGAFFVVAAGADCALGALGALDVPAAGRQVAALLGGKGGGSGKLFQGKASDLGRRAEALTALTALTAPKAPDEA